VVSPIFARASKDIFRTFRERNQGLWLRQGQSIADPIDVQFNDAWVERDANGIQMSDPSPKATVQMSDVLAIDPTRDGRRNDVFLNERRDKITINSRVYDVESCKLDGYSWCELYLIGPADD